MNVFTFSENGKDCEEGRCKIPSVDIDSKGNMIVHYTISGSPKVFTFYKIELNTWYIIEIKQYKDGNEVRNSVVNVLL